MHTDSASTYWALQHGTGRAYRHDFVSNIARDWEKCKERRTFSVIWIPTAANIADRPSRFPLTSPTTQEGDNIPSLTKLLDPNEVTALTDDWDPEEMLSMLAPPTTQQKPDVNPANVIYRLKEANRRF